MYTSAWPIINGEDHSGVTLHKIDYGIDTGDIIDQKSFKLTKNETARSLYFKYLKYSERLFLENFHSLLEKSYTSYPQSQIASSYYSKKSIDYIDLHIDLNKTAYQVNNQIRAFNFREYQLPILLNWKISKGIIKSDRSRLKPGSLVSENEKGFTVSTIDFDIFLQKDYYEIFWNCCLDNDLNYLKKIVENIDELDLRNYQGWNALIIAAFNGHHEIVKVLLDRGSNPSTTNYKNTSAIMYAFNYYLRSKDERPFKLLYLKGADCNLRDYKNKNIYDYVKENHCEFLFN